MRATRGWVPDVVVIAKNSPVFDTPSPKAPVKLRASLGTRLMRAAAPPQNGWIPVALLDGSTGWIPDRTTAELAALEREKADPALLRNGS